MRIRLDRTVCDGFGLCGKRAPGYFTLDDWGYANVAGDGTVPQEDRDKVMLAILDCPVHAITEIGEPKPSIPHPELHDEDDPASHVKIEDNEAEWGFIR